MERIPQSTTRRTLLKAFLSSDHVSAATGKTIAVVLSKNGGAFANPSGGATNATEIANGWYYVDLTTTDTNTKGPLVVRGTEGTIDPTELTLFVVNATNADFTSLPAVAAAANGGVPTVNASNQVDISQTAADRVWASAARTLTSFGTLVTDIWAAGTRTLTSFGTLVSDLWAAATRTLTSFGTLPADVWASGSRTLTGAVTVGTNNDKTGYTLALSPGIKKNAALAAFPFPMFDSTDHVSPKTGLTVTAQVSINGAAFVNCTNSPVEIGNGMYAISLASADTNGDTLAFKFTATGADTTQLSVKTV